jgi:hypothetical protein
LESAKVFKLRLGPFSYELVRSEPLELGYCRLILIARAMSMGRRSATVGWNGIFGWGMYAASLAPIALIEERGSTRRVIPIIDVNRVVRWALAGAGVATLLAVVRAGRTMERGRFPQN